jgi:hypothetical protein
MISSDFIILLTRMPFRVPTLQGHGPGPCQPRAAP